MNLFGTFVTKSWPAAALLAAAPVALQAQPSPPEPPDPQQIQTRVMRMLGGSYLGVGIREVDADRVKELKLHEEAGVEVTRIEEGSPAEKAGLKVGDVILSYNGQRVEGIDQFSRMVHETPAGREVKLAISRGGAAQTLAAKLEQRKMIGPGTIQIPRIAIEPRTIEIPPMPDMPSPMLMWRSPILGVEGESLKGQLADFFGVKEGVLVRSVGKDSPAEKAGIKAGDVITRVNDTKVASPSEISKVLREAKGKTAVPVAVQRDKREVILNATIEGDKTNRPATPAAPVSGRTRGVKL